MNFATARPNYFLTEAEYYQLTGPGFWAINEVPQVRHEHLPQHFNAPDSFMVFASGQAPRVVQQSTTGVMGGIDWIRLESNRRSGEPPINVYHFVIGPSGVNGFPVYGPFHSGALIPHYPSGEFPLGPYLPPETPPV